MYRTREHQMSIYDYLPPYHGDLAEQNRWVRLAAAVDWDAVEREYSGHFGRAGKVALPARVAYGCLVIRAALGVSDRETVALIRESPYLQYFLGFPAFTDVIPFSPRSMERFRARIPAEQIRRAVRLLRRLEEDPGAAP